MSFIISWSGYFSRKRWDPQLWAEANNIKTYAQCVKRISKMHVKPPTEAQFDELFLGRTEEVVQAEAEQRRAQIEAQRPEVSVKVLKPESPPQPPAVKPEKAPTKAVAPAEKKAAPKRKPRRRTAKKPETSDQAGSGTSSIIESVKKKPAAKRPRSRKNVKST